MIDAVILVGAAACSWFLSCLNRAYTEGMNRSAEPRDAASLAALYNYYVLNTVTRFDTEPIDAAKMGRRTGCLRLKARAAIDLFRGSL